MRAKSRERDRAVQMRKDGKTYGEILKVIPVAKSTLSLWLRSVGLAEPQKQRITEKRIAAQMRGAKARFNARAQEVQEYIQQGIREVGEISPREMWLIGAALYWAEGNKQNLKSISSGVLFANSDFRMLRVFLAWLRSLNIQEKDIFFELYVHRDRASEANEFRSWWAKKLDIQEARIDRIYFKKGNPKTLRSNVGDLYHGLLRIKVARSTVLNRKIQGWTEGISRCVI